MNISVNWDLALTIAAGWVIGNAVYAILRAVCLWVASKL